MITLKRAYEVADKQDGFRILIDRLWPRGMSKEKEHLDLWLKEIAPSTQLRKEFGHDPAKWAFFKREYTKELENKKDLLEQIKNLVKEHKAVTLIYGAKDEIYNNAVILKEILEQK